MNKKHFIIQKYHVEALWKLFEKRPNMMLEVGLEQSRRGESFYIQYILRDVDEALRLLREEEEKTNDEK